VDLATINVGHSPGGICTLTCVVYCLSHSVSRAGKASMSDLPFTLDQLRILKAIAAEGSFKRAADSLYVSQPAVSLQVQNLERQLDVPLFDRGGRRAQLTEAGYLLLNYGEKIITLCQETCRALEDLQNLQGGTLIVGASQTTGTYLLPQMMGMFRRRYPDVSVQLHVHSTRRTAWSVANGQVDLAIIGGEVPTELHEGLEIIPYAEDELVLILPSNHHFAHNSTIYKEDLYQLNFIALDSQSTTRKVIDQVLSRYEIETKRLKIEMELNSIEAIKNAVQAGLGVAFVSLSAIEKEIQMGVLYRVQIDNVVVKRMLSVIVNPNRYRSRAAEAFSKEILPLFGKEGWKYEFMEASNIKAESIKSNAATIEDI
jgi:DNA-binding transcriptional LysR family regulator